MRNNFSVEQFIERAAPGADQKAAGFSFANGHGRIVSQALLLGERSKTARIEPIQSTARADPQITFSIFANRKNRVIERATFGRFRKKFSIDEAMQSAVSADP